MDKNLKRQILDIESENMPSILKASGLEFKPEKLLENLEKDQKVITIMKGLELLAYLRYSSNKRGVATIWSIQIRNPDKNKVFLYPLLKKSISEFKNDKVIEIESLVQKGNLNSLKFHQRLGFKTTEVLEKAIRFKVKLNELKIRL